MIVILSGTNRPKNRTSIVARHVFDAIGQFTDEEVNLIRLDEIPGDFIYPGMYEEHTQYPVLTHLQDDIFIPSDKWVILSPEYNGSYSGVLKAFIDALSIRRYKETFFGKKVLLLGVASGRAGNLRGMDHLTTSLNYLGMNIYPNRFPIPLVDDLIQDEKLTGDIIDVLKDLLEGFIGF